MFKYHDSSTVYTRKKKFNEHTMVTCNLYTTYSTYFIIIKVFFFEFINSEILELSSRK